MAAGWNPHLPAMRHTYTCNYRREAGMTVFREIPLEPDAGCRTPPSSARFWLPKPLWHESIEEIIDAGSTVVVEHIGDGAQESRRSTTRSLLRTEERHSSRQTTAQWSMFPCVDGGPGNYMPAHVLHCYCRPYILQQRLSTCKAHGASTATRLHAPAGG